MLYTKINKIEETLKVQMKNNVLLFQHHSIIEKIYKFTKCFLLVTAFPTFQDTDMSCNDRYGKWIVSQL